MGNLWVTTAIAYAFFSPPPSRLQAGKRGAGSPPPICWPHHGNASSSNLPM